MIVEYIRYDIPPARAAEFEHAYSVASKVLDDDEHCLRYELTRGVEEPQHFIVRIEWDSVEGHEQGFRKSKRFPDFFVAVKPFFGQVQEMRHYAVRQSG